MTSIIITNSTFFYTFYTTTLLRR